MGFSGLCSMAVGRGRRALRRILPPCVCVLIPILLWASSSGGGTNGVGTYDQALSSAVGGVLDPFSRAPDVTWGSGLARRDVSDGKPLVAVYFTGQARSLNRTKCSVGRNIFQPLIDRGFQPVVFALGEMDDNAGLYETVLGEKVLPSGVKLGDIQLISRPRVAFPRKEPTVTEVSIPHSCYEALRKKPMRWYHSGGGSEKDSKNTVYGAEVLSQLYYRAKVDEMRLEWEKAEGKKFEWVVNARPDNVYVDALPDLKSLPADGNVYVPSWGHGFDPKSSSKVKRRAGLNDRFAFGGADAMSAYHNLYNRLCSDESIADARMPPKMNFEQMMWWYLTREDVARTVNRVRSIPGEFWFLRLRHGPTSTWPLEHPGHLPPLVKDWPEDKRWEVWSAAARQTWSCDGEQFAERGECWLRLSAESRSGSRWWRWAVSKFWKSAANRAAPGGALDNRFRRRCGLLEA